MANTNGTNGTHPAVSAQNPKNYKANPATIRNEAGQQTIVPSLDNDSRVGIKVDQVAILDGILIFFDQDGMHAVEPAFDSRRDTGKASANDDDGGAVAKKLLDICVRNAKSWDYYTHQNKFIYSDPYLITAGDYTKQFAGHRGQLHKIFLDYAEEVGVEFRFGCEAVDYIETDKSASVQLKTGEVVTGDCVLASDGPRSLARQKLLHLEDKKVNSGYAIYWAFFELTDEHRKTRA